MFPGDPTCDKGTFVGSERTPACPELENTSLSPDLPDPPEPAQFGELVVPWRQPAHARSNKLLFISNKLLFISVPFLRRCSFSVPTSSGPRVWSRLSSGEVLEMRIIPFQLPVDRITASFP